MYELLDRTVETTRRAWSGLTGAQRFGLAALLAILALMVGWTVTTATATPMRVLVSAGESPGKRNQTRQALETLAIPYALKEGAILVEAVDYDRATMELAAEGILSNEEVYEWLKETRPTTTRWTNEKLWLVATQSKLEMMLRKMNAIDRASVLITPATVHARALGGEKGRATATVNVRPRSGRKVTPAVATAVADMVAGAVGMMDRRNVSVIDMSTSRRVPVPSDEEKFASSVRLHDLERAAADQIEERVRTVLGPIVHQFAVAAVAELNSDTRRRFEQLTDENRSFVLRRVEELRKERRIPIGFQVDLVQKAIQELEPKRLGPVVDINESRRENEPQHTFQWTDSERSAGSELERISVSVTIPEDPDRPVAPETLAKLERAVKRAAGTRDDETLKISVISIPYVGAPPAPPVLNMWETIQLHLGEWGKTYLLILLSLVSLFLLYRVVRAALERSRAEETQRPAKPEGEPGLDLGELQSAEESAERSRAELRNMVQRNPQSVAGVLKRWMTPR